MLTSVFHAPLRVLSCPTCSLLGSQVFLSLGSRSCVLGGFGVSVPERLVLQVTSYQESTEPCVVKHDQS